MTYHRVLTVACLLVATARAHGDTVCVNPGGTGGCFASVQAAVDAAGQGDVITIAAGTYTGNVSIGTGRRLRLEGADATTTILDGGGSGRTVDVQGPYTTVTLSGLTIQNSGSDGGLGVPSATVTVTRCRITGNGAEGISSRSLSSFGGRARLTVVESTVEGNVGAGIDQSRILHVVRSTISGNGEGGLRVDRATVADSTVSGNTGASVGGGIAVQWKLRLVRSTVVDNVAAAIGGGVYVTVGGRARSESSILANNVAGGSDNDCVAAEKVLNVGPGDAVFTSSGYNVIENQCAFKGGHGLDVIGQDPLLGPLQDNGGSTPTHALMPGSPALGLVARPRDCKEPDQRGVARALPCDSGAFEAP